MAGQEPVQITQLLRAWQAGDEQAFQELVPLIYQELKKAARHCLQGENSAEMETTDLIHEAYLRLAGVHDVEWKDRVHFFAVASRVMRHILVDAARARHSDKRFGKLKRAGASGELRLDRTAAPGAAWRDEVLMVHEALEKLEAVGPRQARVVEMRYFGGLSVEEAAAVLQVSPHTVKRDWQLARAWLRKQMGGPAAD